MSETFLP